MSWFIVFSFVQLLITWNACAPVARLSFFGVFPNFSSVFSRFFQFSFSLYFLS